MRSQDFETGLMPTKAFWKTRGTNAIPGFPPKKFFHNSIFQRMIRNYGQSASRFHYSGNVLQKLPQVIQFRIHRDTHGLEYLREDFLFKMRICEAGDNPRQLGSGLRGLLFDSFSYFISIGNFTV
jgi:hypothetical protein